MAQRLLAPVAGVNESADNAHRHPTAASSNWSFKPAPVPWYRTRRATLALIATALAAAAIVVSGVLLLLRDSAPGDTQSPTTSPSPSTPVYRPTHRPTPTKKPEIGVTRTPVTRSPISVAPQPRHPRN